MTTKKERETKELRTVCGYVDKKLIEEIKGILGARGWQEKVLSQSLALSLEFLKTASKYDVVDFLFSEDIGKVFKIKRLCHDPNLVKENREDL